MDHEPKIFMKIHMRQGSKILYATLNRIDQIQELTPDVIHIPSLEGSELVLNREAISHMEIYPYMNKEAING